MIESPEKENNVIEIDSVDSLKEILEQHNIDTSLFGKNNAKRLEDLFNETREGETTIIKEGEKIFRKVYALGISINYVYQGKRYLLVEDKQVFSDGRERQRFMDGSLGEKLKRGEDKAKAIKRALLEELGIQTTYNPIFKKETYDTRKSSSYPDLSTKYCIYLYEIDLKDKDFKEEGYIENEASTGLTTYFVWKEVN